jgi:hypothetical protein
MNIKKAVKTIVEIANIRSKEDLNVWCGDRGRQKLYEYVKLLAPEHWAQLQEPECGVRACYERMLTGYKIYRV